MAEQTESDPPVPSAETIPSDAVKVNPRLLELLVCPLTRTTLHYDAERQELVSRAAKLAYPIRGGIPIMLPDAARRLEE
jgi:uncharacterized protein